MKSLSRLILVFAILNLTMGSFALAQDNPEGKRNTFNISGSVGLSGVVMKGLPGNPITDINGFYTVTVERGWSGTVAPIKEGYTFDPPSRSYPKTTANQTDQNYAARIITFIISGSVGQKIVEMCGLPGNPISSSDGNYKATVPYGWAGLVIPRSKGYTFEPTSRMYAAVTYDQTDQDYLAHTLMLTISDRLVVGGYPIEGVLMSASKGGISDTTDTEGRYSVKVPYGWSGEITPSKKGFDFDPPSKSYANVTTDIIDGQPVPPGIRKTSGYRRGTVPTTRPALWRTDRRKVLVIPVTDVNATDVDEITQDLYVMSHILDQKFTERRQIAGVFTDFGDFFGRDERETEAIYIQDYGVLFLMEVNFAFSQPPQPQEKQEEQTEKQLDPTWQRAQRELFSPERPGNIPGGFGPAGGYDAQMVEELKTELIRTLKHAANIRSLEADEWVILNVTGTGQRTIGDSRGGGYGAGGIGGYGTGGYGGGMMSGYGGIYGGRYAGGGGGSSSFGMGGGMMGMGAYYGEMGLPSATVLTIRAKKSDIDAFAKGDIDFEQFQKKVNILIY
jgi:hypothetical protein